MPAARAWPLATPTALRPALDRLMALGEGWAARRGLEWSAVLNDGVVRGPLHRFRWEVVGAAAGFSAGGGTAPPADFEALPLGLQAFLAWAIPAALAGPSAAGVDLGRSRQALAEAERWAADITGEAGGTPARSPRGVAGSPPDPAGAPLPSGRPDPARAEPAFPPPAADVAAVLAAALGGAPAGAGPLAPGAAAVLRRLRSGPIPLPELRALADAHGTLPGSLLDALDTWAVRSTGSPATRIEGNAVRPTAEYLAAAARGEDPLA